MVLTSVQCAHNWNPKSLGLAAPQRNPNFMNMNINVAVCQMKLGKTKRMSLILITLSIFFIQLLAKLLKSKNPDDLQEANKLIKSMVKEVRLHTKEHICGGNNGLVL